MSRSANKLTQLVAIVMLVMVALTSCGGGASNSNKPVDVNVNLTEFKIESSVTSFKVGVPYHFIVTNNGSVPHEFNIMPPESGPLTTDQVKQMALVQIGQSDLAAGVTAILDYTFTQEYPQGMLELTCHLPGHYEAGMHVPIEVTK